MDLYVRVKPKSGATQFYRCAMLFTIAWTLVQVDEATAQRLAEEQMLETSAERPADYPLPAASAAEGTPPAAPHTHEVHHATPVEAVNITAEGAGEAGAVVQASSLQAQAEAEAAEQLRQEVAAESASPAPSSKPKKPAKK